jgi:hypothetical protein
MSLESSVIGHQLTAPGLRRRGRYLSSVQHRRWDQMVSALVRHLLFADCPARVGLAWPRRFLRIT